MLTSSRTPRTTAKVRIITRAGTTQLSQAMRYSRPPALACQKSLRLATKSSERHVRVQKVAASLSVSLANQTLLPHTVSKASMEEINCIWTHQLDKTRPESAQNRESSITIGS